MQFLIVLVALVSSLSSQGAFGAVVWKNGGNNICTGYENTDYTETYIGRCAPGATSPTDFLKQTFVGVLETDGTIDGTTAQYLNGGTIPTVHGTSYENGLTETNPFISNDWPPETSYDRISAVSSFDIGGTNSFLSISSYVCQSGFITYMDNHMYFNSVPDSALVCVSPPVSSTCVTEYTAVPGTLKFSVFMQSVGANWATTFNTATHIGIRTEIEYPAGTTITYNNEGAASGEDDVKVIDFTSMTLQLKFRSTYNYGDFDAGCPNMHCQQSTSGSNDIHIKVSDSGNPNSLYVDYWFDKDDINVQNKYVVFDPTFQDDNTSSDSLSTGAIVGIAVGSVVVVVGVVVLFIMKSKSNRVQG